MTATDFCSVFFKWKNQVWIPLEVYFKFQLQVKNNTKVFRRSDIGGDGEQCNWLASLEIVRAEHKSLSFTSVEMEKM